MTIKIKQQMLEESEKTKTSHLKTIQSTPYAVETLIKSMENQLFREALHVQAETVDKSFNFKSQRTIVTLKDLTNRQFIMTIFDYLPTENRT